MYATKSMAHPESKSAGGKALKFDGNYLIFPDGRVWTTHNKRFLTPIKRVNRDKIYYTYILRGRKPYHINKLVWLHFGKHDIDYYIDVKNVTHKNKNPLDFTIENLVESNH